ncbi:hypothetical protein ACQPYA_18675 [Micromonospora sp. CA-263727]|uniref:hypothetical protein n=1 Tax=Micromonospora sp. CA-263727 TaxID=3239967 RepID=UPI003D8C4220
MGLFSRGPKRAASRFPHDIVRTLELFGRFEANPQGSGVDYDEVVHKLFIPYVEQANADPDGFFTDLRAVVANDAGGYATFGAARLVWELLTGDMKKNPPAPALTLVKAGVEFKRAHGLGLTMWEMDLDLLP